MLAAEEKAAILFEQEVATAGLVAAMAVAKDEHLHIGCCSRLDLEEAHDKNPGFAASIGLEFEEERERPGCARCLQD